MEIACKFKTLSSNYCCFVTSSYIDQRAVKIKEFKGEHEAKKSDRDVDLLYIHYQRINFIPRGFTENFGNLRSLKITSCDLRELIRDDFIGLDFLEEINFSSNSITFLDDDLLADMLKLKIISFSENEIIYVSSKLISHLDSQLKIADFSSNVIVDCSYNSDSINSVSFKEFLNQMDSGWMESRESAVQVESFGKGLAAKFEGLWDSKRFSDFTIIADAKEFQVHKSVLGIQSPVFSEMFADNSSDAQAQLTLDGFSSGAVEEFLAFLYTGTIPNATPEETNATDLFRLASKYEVPQLKEISQKIILNNIDDLNPLEIFVLGDEHNEQNLMKKAFKLIQEDYDDIPDDLLEHPAAVKELVEAKDKLEEVLQNIRHTHKVEM